MHGNPARVPVSQESLETEKPHREPHIARARADTDPACLRADRLAMALRAARERLEVPLARAARAFTLKKGWFVFGHARLEDHARERFGRSARWVRDLALRGKALALLPALRDAFTGDDGARPLGTVATLCIGRIATPDSVGAWIELARRVTVRELRDVARSARAAGSSWPARGDDESSQGSTSLPRTAPQEGDEAEPVATTTLRIQIPAAVRAAFDEALDLYRAVVGGHTTVGSFIEALVAEAAGGVDPVELEPDPPQPRPALATREQALARSTGHWRHLPGSVPASAAVLCAGSTLRALDELSALAGFGEPAELDTQLRGLIALQTEIDRQLGEILVEMSQQDAWRRLRFAGVGHYGEERLGLSRTTAEDTARLARAFHRFPLLRAAHTEGRVGSEAAQLVARLLGREPVEEQLERAWVARAEAVTVKRLRDEMRLLGREAVLPTHPMSHPRRRVDPQRSWPPTDAEWHASLRREPGTSRERVEKMGREAVPVFSPDVLLWNLGTVGTPVDQVPETFRPLWHKAQAQGDVQLRLCLSSPLAYDFFSCLQFFRGRWRRLADADLEAQGPPSLQAARAYRRRHLPLPLWVGFLALLEEFVHIWDDPQAMPKRPGDAVYSRDGWRCTAPGCTSRKHLEDHHVVYRSRGGGDELSNRTCLCRFHHQRGEHGELASCRGSAPLNLHWRLGRRELGARFRSERRQTAGRP